MIEGKRIIITYGSFDLIHQGHINLLKKAKKLGDYLIVGVSSDYMHEQKGKKCVQPFETRKLIIESLKFVDEVIEEEGWRQKEDDINNNSVDILVMGSDWINNFEDLPCSVVFLNRTPGISTTMLKEKMKNEKED